MQLPAEHRAPMPLGFDPQDSARAAPSLSPEGRRDNSPRFQPWERATECDEVPKGPPKSRVVSAVLSGLPTLNSALRSAIETLPSFVYGRLCWLHSQDLLRALVQDRFGNRECFIQGILPLIDFFRQNPGQLPPHNHCLGVGPFDAIRIGEETNLLVRGEHIQSLGHYLSDNIWKEIVPPIACEGQIRQLASQRAKRLIRVAAGQETLEFQFGMTSYELAQLPDSFLPEATAGFIGQRLGAEAELKNDPVPSFFQLGEEGFINIAGVGIPLGDAGLFAAGEGRFHLGVAHQAVIDFGG